ncbi:NAD(P)H-binding protein [Actinocrinis puniceicyclus]|uniref:NAD(P)H-binding protein n=1 Tax=Actinocrinis puniceicyclus TaxID=977794 RepID=A0A8J8BBN5_9ACTN|nr:NAD(P)H-binding protein [Actinocrinis puniceicyclus]MBS2962256.1 NAD(P)H-binding protein [Actinocrinis puniceicyclus]
MPQPDEHGREDDSRDYSRDYSRDENSRNDDGRDVTVRGGSEHGGSEHDDPPEALRIFLAGATGVIGVRLLPLLLRAGHAVAAMTRSAAKADSLAAMGAQPVVCDVFDAEALREAVVAFRPDAVLHQLTDLPDKAEQVPEFAARNARIRTEGTRNLLAAAQEAGARHFLAQSIDWIPAGGGAVLEEHEQRVLKVGGVVVRYGQFYGPDTFYEHEVPSRPRIHVDAAARETVPLITAASGVFVLAEAQ